MSLSAKRWNADGNATPASGRPSRGVRHNTRSATNVTTSAAAAPTNASVNGSGSSVAVPTPCAGSAKPLTRLLINPTSPARRTHASRARRAAFGRLRAELVLVDELRQLGVVRAL